MYAKLFASIYQGTLRGNTHGLVVFTNMLAHADAAGWVDMHPKAIAEEVGLTLEEVKEAIRDLEAPDIESRSPEEGGRRIVLLDEHRAWGWRIVNHAKYRAIRSEEDRREQNRLAQERFRNRHKHDSNESKPRKPPSAQAEAEAEAEAVFTHPTDVYVETGKPSRQPACPTDELVSLYHKHLPMLPHVEVLNTSRKRAISARWHEVLSDCDIRKEPDSRSAALDWFDWFFGHCVKSKFLTGKAKDWRADFDFLMSANKFAKIVEGSYHKERA